MAETPVGGVALLEAGQAGAIEPFNETTLRAPLYSHLILESATTTAEPVAPIDGQVYFVPTGATGTVWAGNDGKLALRLGGAWEFYDPGAGMMAVVLDAGRAVWWHATLARWVPQGMAVAVEDVTLSGASADTAADLLPDGAILHGVYSEVLTEISGAAGYDIGRIGALTDHGGNLTGLTVGSSYHGAINPVALYADAPLRVTAQGGSFTGGVLRLAAYFARF